MNIDELIEELTRLRGIYGGETKVKVTGIRPIVNDEGETQNALRMESLDRVRLSPDDNRCVELLP